jgi:hypothetical protein
LQNAGYVMAVALALLLAACGGTPSPPAPPSTAVTAPTSLAPSTPPASKFGGIIVADVSFDNTVTLDAIDPATGNVTATRTFTGGQAQLTIDPMDQRMIWRSDFNNSFTEAAASGPQASDGSQSAGYVNLGEIYTALTAGATGYSSVLDKIAIGFAPDGDLWYMIQGSSGSSGVQFGHVNPAAGPSSDQAYNGTAPYESDASGSERAYITQAGVPDAVSAALTTMWLPGGTEVTQDLNGPGYLIGPWAKISSSTPDTPIKGGGDDWMVAPVNSRQFLTEDNAKTELWLNTIAKGAVWTTPLLPVTNRSFTSAVVSPDGQTVAVLDSDGTLWTVPVTGGQPKQVAGLNMTSYTELVAWTPS